MLTTQSFLVTAAINLALGLVLIPAQGAIDAAIATAVSAAAGSAWCAWRLWRRTGYNTSVFNRALPGIVASYARAGLAVARGGTRGQ